MTPDDIQKAIHDGIEAALKTQLQTAISAAVDVSVNGKIKTLDEKVTPMAEAYGKWLSLKRIAIIGFGLMLALGGLISTVQTLWSLIAGHLVVK